MTSPFSPASETFALNAGEWIPMGMTGHEGSGKGSEQPLKKLARRPSVLSEELEPLL